MIINENNLKENLFNFIKNNSSLEEYKKAVRIFSENGIVHQNIKFDNYKFSITTSLYNRVNTSISINPNSYELNYNCSSDGSLLCRHTIASFLHFLSNYNFKYNETISPIDLITVNETEKEFEGIIVDENCFRHALILNKKNSSFYLKKYLDSESFSENKTEQLLSHLQYLKTPKYFIQKGKRVLTELKLSDETQKIVLNIEKLNNYYVEILPVLENENKIFTTLNGILKRIFIYFDGTVKILPPEINFNLLAKHFKESFIITEKQLNELICNEKFLKEKNLKINRKEIKGFSVINEKPKINIYIDSINESLKLTVTLQYRDKILNILHSERIIDNDIFPRDEEEFKIIDIFNKLNAKINKDFFILDKDNSLKFLMEILPKEFVNYNIFGEEKLTKYRIYKPVSSPNIRFFSFEEWFEVSGELEFEDKKISLLEVAKNIKQGKNYIKLKKNHYGIIPENFLQQLRTIMDDSSFKVDKENKTFKIFKLDATSKLNLISSISENKDIVNEISEIKNKIKNFNSIKKYKISGKLDKVLREYQKEGVNWLLFLRDFNLNGILSDEMGLGKTLQALTLLNFEIKNKPNLVIVPTSLLYNWDNELQKFAYDFHYLILYGKNRETLYKDMENYDLILTTYNIVRLDFEKIQDMSFNYIILDESQYIKNPSSVISKYIKNLKSNHRLSLTGTPFENSITDIWSQFDFLHPGIFGSLKNFKKHYQNNIESLKKKLSPLILRRKKDDVLSELPEKTEINYFYEMNIEQREFYDSVKAFYLEKITSALSSEGFNKSKLLIVEGLLRLRQICCHPKISKFEHIKHKNVKSEKFENLKKLIVNFNNKNQKTVIYSQFVQMLKIIKRFMNNANINFEYLDGLTRNRLEKINNFQNNDNVKFFLVSTKAGGLGINLTSAENVIIYDPWWNPSVENQAIDRIHRIGQEKKVFAYRLIIKNSVEEKILKLQQKKNDIFQQLFQKTTSIQNLTKEDIELIFR